MVAVADAQVGIPDGNGPHGMEFGEELHRRMFDIDEALKHEEPPRGLRDLYDTLSRAISHVRERRVRHDYFYRMLTLPKASWRDWWAEIVSD